MISCLLASRPAGAQLVGRFREIQFRFLGGCTNGSESPDNQNRSEPSGTVVAAALDCVGGTSRLTVDYQVPASTPVVTSLPGFFDTPITLTMTVTARWTTPPSPPYPPGPYRLTVAAGLGTCLDRKERNDLPAGTNTLSAAKSCTAGFAPPSSADPLATLNGGFSAGATSGGWGGISFLASVFYDFGPAPDDADVSLVVTGPAVGGDGFPLRPQVVVRNAGPLTASQPAVSVEFLSFTCGPGPDGCSIQSPPGCPALTPALYRCTTGDLAPGQSRALDFVISTPLERSVRFTVAAAVESATRDPVAENNRASASFETADCSELGCPLTLAICRQQGGGAAGNARSAAGREEAPTLAEPPADLRPFYRLRDEVFSLSAAGRRYTELYYAHSAEVTARLGTDASFRDQFLSAYGLWSAHVARLVDGESAAAVVTQAQVDALLGLLASLESGGSPELRGAIARERAALDLPTLAGKTMAEALARQQATAPAVATVPAAASIHGVAPAFFHTDARVFNPSATTAASVTARFRCYTGSCPSDPVRTFGVAPREMKVLDDVVVSLFGAPETAGPVEFEGPVLVETRNYTPSRPDPTTGAVIPGLTSDRSYPEALLASLSHSADLARGFRTNAGAYNPNDTPVTATFSLFTAAGSPLGSATRSIGARSAVQVNNVFVQAGVTSDVADAYAVVRADGVLPLFAYATVIDNQSQDPTFVAPRNARGASDGVVTVPATASIHGVAPAFFHSDARVFNPSRTVPVEVFARFRCFTGPCPADPVRSFVVAPREMKVFDDLLVSLFAAPETAGPVEFSGAVHVDTRNYTPTRPSPTAGSGIPGLALAEATGAGVLLALSHSPDLARGFRTNVGVFNPDPFARSVTVTLHRPDGSKLGEAARTVGGSAALQINNVFVAAGVAGDVPDAYALVTSADGRPVFSYATVIENRTGDSIFVSGRPLR